MRPFLLFSLVALCFEPGTLRAEVLSQEMQVDLDSAGDATVSVKERYPAEGWFRWKRSLGDHPDLVVRNKKREYAAWDFSDFAFTKDEVSRTAESKMKVRALAQLLRDGNYSLSKLIGGLHLVTNKGHEWIFSGRSEEDSGDETATEQTVHVNLPPTSFGARIANPDTNDKELIYSVPAQGDKSSMLLLLGSGFGIFGVMMLGISRRTQKSLRPALPVSIKPVSGLPLPSGAAKWQLVGRTPGGRSLRLEVTEAMFSSNGNRIVLGRTAELCHVVIDDGSVSKQHAQIRKEGNNLMVADRNSSNGTAVNGQFSRQPFDEVPLKEGDTLTLGEVKLDFTGG
jgi:FHA domain